MLRNIGKNQASLEQKISEIYKSNVKLSLKAIASAKKKEIVLCKHEAKLILHAYETMLSEATKVMISNIYADLEKMVGDLMPHFKVNYTFVSELIRSEIDPLEDIEFDFRDVEVTTGSQHFYDIFYDIFELKLDVDLGEDLLIFKYNNTIKTIDFSNISSNIIKDVLTCREKHLSMIDAIRTKV